MQTEKQYTVLLIDDSPEDRATYCRYLQRGSSHAYQVLEAVSATVGLDLYQRLLPDAVLLDYSLPDMDGLECLALMQSAGKQRVPILMLTGQGNATIATQAMKRGAQDYLIKGKLTAEGLCKALEHAIEQLQLQQRLQQQEQQQQILNAIALRIRQALTLQTILDTSVAAVRQYLSADRVVIYQFAPDMGGQIVAEAVLPEWLDSLHTQIEDTCFQGNLGGDYRLGKTRAIADIHAAGLTDCHIQLLERFQVKANLVVPLLITDPDAASALPRLWGLLVAHQCSATRQWQPFETDLLNQVAVQMAIAIQQAELYRQLQTELAERRHTEAILRVSEQRYATLTEMSPVGLFQTDAVGNCLYVNERWCQIAGLPPAEATGFGWINGVHPADRDVFSTEWHASAQAGCPFYLEYRCQKAAGQITWVLGQAVVERGATGEIIGYVGTITDISDRKQAEVALNQLNRDLQAGERKFRAIFNNTFQFIGLLALDGTLLEANQAALAFGDLQLEDLINRPFWECHWWTMSAATQRQLQQAIARAAQGEFVRYEVDVLGSGGQISTIDFSLRPLRDEFGQVILLIPEGRDISDRKQAEASLQQLNQELETRVQERTAKLQASEARLREAQRIAHVGDWEFALASQTITWSEELFRLFECDPAQGEPEYAGHLQSYVLESRLQLEHAVQQAATLGTPYELELQFSRADGSVKWLFARGEAVRNAQGAIVKLLGTALDITDRKQAEVQLRHLSDRLTLAVKSGAIAIWDWNVTENILTWDDRMYALYGITPNQFTNVYDAWAKSVHPDDRSFAEAALQHTLAGEKDYDIEFRVIHPDGTIRFLKAYALVERAEQGELKQMVGINYDITDRKQAEQALQQLTLDLQRSNQELEQFAYVASHDLQEPLRAITSYTQLLAKRYQGQLDEKADKYIYYVVDGAARMQQLIQDLLAYSRVGRHELKLQLTDCNAVLQQVQKDLQAAIAESNAILTIDLLPTIFADTVQVTQLFQNLVGNALKYRGDASPMIRVSARHQSNAWVFSIQDNGIGLEPQYAERIFEIFQRLHTRREYEGTGLGLAICKKIVERHRGHLWVESQLGQGALFCFTLPALLNG